MPEALHSFLVSVSCIVGVAVLIPSIETITRLLRRNSTPIEPREVVHLTPAPPQRRGF
jgi:hypothetical protein